MESCDVYIKSVTYEDLGWIDDPDLILEQVFNNLSEIPHFYFVSLSLNMAEVFNVNLQQSNYESMLLYIKGVKYKHHEFLGLPDVQEMIEKIKQQLGYIENLYTGKIEIRSSKLYTDKVLGIS